jgi:hypothetical protein
MVCKFSNLPPDIDRIVLEQHEMPNGAGFPRKLLSNQIGQLSCLFILTGIWARYVLKKREKFNFKNFIDEIESQGYGNGNFSEPLQAIKKMHANSIKNNN